MISVCMATYNGERFLRQQIDSIISQLGEDDELIISDNGSTDGTLEIINSYKDKRIKLFHYPKSSEKLNTKIKKDKNITNNFENGLRNCKGDIICLSDQDDVWTSNKLATQIRCLENYELVMSNATTIDEFGNVIKEKLYDVNPIKKGIFSFRARGCLYIFKRELLEKALPIPRSVFSHDLWLITLAEFRKTVLFIDESLVLHRRGIGNASTDVSEKSKNPLWFKLYYRIELLVDGFVRTKLQR